MPYKNINVPKEEQLQALAQGISAFYNLLERYGFSSDVSNKFHSCMTITKDDLINYINEHPELIQKNVYKAGSSRYHEQIILDYDGQKYRVYEMDHDEPRDMTEYNDPAEATADYLIYNLGLPPGFFEYIK